MKQRKLILLVIVLLSVGFAAVSTTLFINGNTDIIANQDDFNVYFSDAYVNKVQDKSVIVEDTVIEFNTEFSKVGQEYILDYEVTNGSKNYDAELKMNCVSSSEYLTVTNKFDDESILPSMDYRSGRLNIELTKSYVGEDFNVKIECTLDVNAVERTSLGVVTRKEISVVALDNNSNDLDAKAFEITGNSKTDLVMLLKASKNIDDTMNVRSIVEFENENINEVSLATFDVSSVSAVNDNIVVLNFNDDTSEWEYISYDVVNEEGRAIIDFSSVEVIPFAIQNEDGSLSIKLTTIEFDANGGEVLETARTLIYNQPIGDLLTPTRVGYTFAGWYTSTSGGEQVNKATLARDDMKVYAQWNPNQYLVKFNANSGNVEISSKEVTYDSTYGELPIPTKTGYIFAGWYTAASGGTQVTASTTVTITSEQNLYAHWTLNNYTVTLKSGGNGTVGVTSVAVPYGGTKTFTVTPNNGYYLSSISCTNGYTVSGFTTGISHLSTQTVTVSNNNNDSDSICTASFIKLPTPTATGGSNSWKSSNVTVSLTNKPTLLGNATYEYYVTTSTTAPTASTAATGTTTNSVTISDNGTRYVYFRLKANDNSKSAWSSAQKVMLDKTVPTITLNSSVPASVTKGDSYALISSYTTSSISGGTVSCSSNINGTLSSNNTSVLTSVGTHTITCTSKTGAGKTATVSKTVKITYTAYTIKNLIVNGSFESTSYNKTNVVSSSEYYVHGGKSLKVTSSATTSHDVLDITNISTPVGHKFYSFGYTYVKALSNEGYATQEFLDDTGFNLGSWHYWETSSDWKKKSMLSTSTYATTTLRLGLWNITSNSVAYFDSFILVDLTAAFGSGNEPDKAWCDKHITYFDGSKTIYK